MTEEQTKKILSTLKEVEAWAGGLLESCAKLNLLIEDAEPASKRQKFEGALSPEELAEISVKRHIRRHRPRKQ